MTTLACSTLDMETLEKAGDLISGTPEQRSSGGGRGLFMLRAATLLRRKRCNCHEARRSNPMARQKLDAIDRQILVELQADGRMTNVELAKRVKITAPPCLRRVRALEKAGYIQGYHADLDAAALGYAVTAYAFVGLASQAEADLKAFEDEVRTWPQVRSCYMLSGEVDFILRCVARDLPE